MINQPETQGVQPQEDKLVSPTYPQQVPPVYPDSANPAASNNTANVHHPQISPDQLIRPTAATPPKNLLVRLGYFWQKDPAYKVLMIAVVLVLVASVIFVSVISNTLSRNPQLLTISDPSSQNPPTAVVPTGTVDLRPAFPTPAGGNGSTSSSQPPTQGTPALQSTPGASPTANSTPSSGQLTVTITSIPNHVPNHSFVNVSVNTSEPNVIVILGVYYNVPPYRYSSGPVTTDGNGNAVLPWSVTVIMFGRQTKATVFVVARDQNGQKAQTQATVLITSTGG